MRPTKLLGILMAFLCSFAFVCCDSNEVYFKSKCTAVLNGQIYYDQLLLKAILNPSTTVTPSIEQPENCIVFHTWLCKKKRRLTGKLSGILT